jgi:hypothetical protein
MVSWTADEPTAIALASASPCSTPGGSLTSMANTVLALGAEEDDPQITQRTQISKTDEEQVGVL